MRHYKLQASQAAANGGFTDLWVVGHADLTTATDNTAQTLTLDALEMGDLVGYTALAEIREAFDAANVSADNALTVSLGVTGATTQFIGASALTAAGVGTAVKTGYAPAAGGAPYYTPSGGKDILATFTITDADGALADFSTGEIGIWLIINRWASRSQMQA